MQFVIGYKELTATT